MAKLSDRATLFLSQIFFTVALVPLFLLPGFAGARLIRRMIAYLFGHLLSGRYQRIIGFYGESYGKALDAGLEAATSLSAIEINRIVDCGTGTGFAAKQAALKFCRATVIGVDIVPDMLKQARASAENTGLQITHLYADTKQLPFGNQVVDMVVAQNTIPFLIEFGRVCRPGGIVIFVDTAARWIVPVARYAASRTGLFDAIEVKKAGVGFYLAARRRR